MVSRGTLWSPLSKHGATPALVGGGYGVAPLAWLAETFSRQGVSPTAFIGGRNEADIIGAAKFEGRVKEAHQLRIVSMKMTPMYLLWRSI